MDFDEEYQDIIQKSFGKRDELYCDEAFQMLHFNMKNLAHYGDESYIVGEFSKCVLYPSEGTSVDDYIVLMRERLKVMDNVEEKRTSKTCPELNQLESVMKEGEIYTMDKNDLDKIQSGRQSSLITRIPVKYQEGYMCLS